MPKYQSSIFKLSNNLTCLHLPVESSESVLVSLLGKVGRRAEKENEVGAAHFLEHLFFDGTKSRPTSFDINNYIESYGGRRNGGTSSETVEYFAKVLAKDAEVAFDFISDIFLNSLLKEIERERRVIEQEVAAKKDNPGDILGRLSLANLYPSQSVGRTIYDEENTLPTMSETILRGYMDRTYIAENFVLTISGNINFEKSKRLASKYFNKIKSGQEISFERPQIRKEQNLVVTKKDLNQSKLAINFRAFPVDTRESIFSWLGGIILGSGSSSRLYQRLRIDQKLVYSVYTNQTKFSDTGYFGVATFVDEKNVQKATNAIFEEINVFLEKGITDEELKTAKNKYLANFFFKFDDLFSYSSHLSFSLLFAGKIKSVEEIKNEVESATKEDVMKVAKHIFLDKPKVNLLTKNLDDIDIKGVKT